jgi:hypothetical protein
LAYSDSREQCLSVVGIACVDTLADDGLVMLHLPAEVCLGKGLGRGLLLDSCADKQLFL